MPPGEPVGSNSSQDEEAAPNQYLSDGKYHVKFKDTDWFVEPLLNFDGDSSSMENVYNAVAYWTEIALELKSKNYPIVEGIDNWKSFDNESREKAHMLDDMLDMLITEQLLQSDKPFEVLRVLIAQGSPYLKFKDKMSSVDFSLKCNTIWENDAVAYRCNTCALTPCMSLCETCFDANGHVGHDYTRFFSREGGACDCGNQDVIREQGNCPGHGDESKRPKYDMRDVCLAEHIVMKLLVRLFIYYRGWQERYEIMHAEIRKRVEEMNPRPRREVFDFGLFVEKDGSSANKLVDFLQECANYGGPMRMIVSEVLLNKDLYAWLTEKTGEHFHKGDRVQLSLDWRTSRKFVADRKTVLLPNEFAHLFPLVETIEGLECHSLLDELIFWINRKLFPQNLVNFGLGMLSEPGYRDAFAYRFFAWYPICGKVIRDLCASQAAQGRGEDRVSPACSRAVHVTVQMLSSATLCKELNEKVNLVKVIFDVTRFLICEQLEESQLSLEVYNVFVEKFKDIDCSLDERLPWKVMTMQRNAAISQHGYWFVMGDIQNVLTHTPLAIGAVIDDDCFGGSYMEMMCQMQGMNPIWRIVTGNALEIDTGEQVQKAYTLEFETLAVTLFNIIAAIQQESCLESAKRFFDHVRKQLRSWFRHNCLAKPEEEVEEWGRCMRAQAYALSFHIPLHRHISTAVTHFVEVDGFYEYVRQELLVDETFVRLLLLHPLRIQVARSEINCGMWVRNGSQARMSSLIYAQWNVSSAFQTPDVDLIRFCGAHIEKEHFAKVLSMGFYLTEKIYYSSPRLRRFLPVVRKVFGGCGNDIDTTNYYPDEQQEILFNKLRSLIRENPRQMEEVIRNPYGPIEEGSKFDENMRTQIIQLLEDDFIITHLRIELSNRYVRPISPTPLRSVPIALRQMLRNHGVFEREARNDGMNQAAIDSDGEEDDDEEDEEEEEEEEEEGLLANFMQGNDPPRRPDVLAPRPYEGDECRRLPVLREPEWIDPMFWGLFKLVAEIVVVRVNSGATSKEHYRQEMVNCMAMGNVPYSRLRASISEKGSRGSELIDKHFEKILGEIGDFVEPNETTNFLQQGSYQLKTSVWNSELCPVFFMMRSPSIKHAREIFAKMEKRERKQASEKNEKGDVRTEEEFWVPFRLIDFSENLRHQGISEIYKILLTERFIMHCVTVLAMGQDSLAKFHDATIQLAVYLLTLGVKYAQEYAGDQDEKDFLKDFYHTPFALRKDGETSSNFITVCSFMIRLVEEEARKNDSFVPLFRNILSEVYDQQKVTGGRMIYLARFLTILCKLSPTCREIVQDKLTVEEILLSKLVIKEESAKKAIDPTKAAAKEAAKRRMAAIMAKSATKNAQTMQKLMEKEGMTAAEVETVDPSQQNRKLYECPICGEQDTPNTVEHPFGMLAKLSTNFFCEEQVDANSSPIKNLLESDNMVDSDELRIRLETRRNYADKRRMANVENPTPEVSKVRAPLVGTDLKTCGHAAHILCFNAYRSSLYDGRSRQSDRREVGCPLCRYTVNMIVPVSFDKPYAPIKTPQSPLSHSEVWKTMNTILQKAKGPVFQEDSKNVKYATLYSTREGGGLNEVWTGRQHSADWTERQSTFEKCTVSTVMVSLAVSMVERASLLRILKVPERRKHARNSLTAHIMTASVATSKDVDFDVTLSALTSLFAKIPACNPSSTSTPSTSSVSSPPSTTANEASSSVTPPPQNSNPASRETTPKNVRSLAELTPDDLVALATVLQKSNRKRPMEGESEVRTLVPLFVLDPKPTLVRMLAVLIDNQSVTKEVQQEIALNMVRATTGWLCAYTTLCLLLRLGEGKMRAIARAELKIEGLGENQQELAESIANALTSNPSFFEFMLQKLASPDIELLDEVFVQTLRTAIVNYLRFTSELMFHCGLGTVETAEFVHNSQNGLEEIMDVLRLGPSCLHQTEQGNYWTKMYRHNLGWMSKLNRFFQPCISEPLTWKPRQILRPPDSFEELFTKYFHRQCLNCTTSPSNAVVCLLCGDLLCLDDCCRVTHQEVGSDRILSMTEIEAHAERCSSSTGIFISVTSSMVLIMRGKQAAIWGTIYLDSHKEEDRNLRRGKPLFLCESRLKWLEYDWAEQEWQRVYNWISLANSQTLINSIRDCHSPHLP